MNDNFSILLLEINNIIRKFEKKTYMRKKNRLKLKL